MIDYTYDVGLDGAARLPHRQRAARPGARRAVHAPPAAGAHRRGAPERPPGSLTAQLLEPSLNTSWQPADAGAARAARARPAAAHGSAAPRTATSRHRPRAAGRLRGRNQGSRRARALRGNGPTCSRPKPRRAPWRSRAAQQCEYISIGIHWAKFSPRTRRAASRSPNATEAGTGGAAARRGLPLRRGQRADAERRRRAAAAAAVAISATASPRRSRSAPGLRPRQRLRRGGAQFAAPPGGVPRCFRTLRPLRHNVGHLSAAHGPLDGQEPRATPRLERRVRAAARGRAETGGARARGAAAAAAGRRRSRARRRAVPRRRRPLVGRASLFRVPAVAARHGGDRRAPAAQ